MIRRVITCLLALTLATLSMGAEGCDKNAPAGGSGTRPDPNPNPDTGPGVKPKTPNPGAGDPKPGSKHTYSLFLVWAPVRQAIIIDWEVGPHGPLFGHDFQRTGGEWSVTKTVTGDADAFVEGMFEKNTPGGVYVKCVLVRDGQVVVEKQFTLPVVSKTREGVTCTYLGKD